MSTINIYVPQWGTVVADQLVLSNVSATTFSNSTLGTSAYKSSFSVSGNDLYLLARAQNGSAYTDTLSPQTLADQSGNSQNILFNVFPAPMTLSQGGFTLNNPIIQLYQQRTQGLPFTLGPTLNASGSINGVPFEASLSGITFTSNAQFVPTLPPGLTFTLSDQTGIVSGVPTATRVNPSVYTYQIKGTGGRLLSQAITLSVQNPQIAQSTISGFQGSTEQVLRATMVQGVPNEHQVLIEPSPTQLPAIASLPPGLSASLSGGNVLVLSGTPSMYPDDGIFTTTVTTTTPQQSSNTTLTLSQNPAVEIMAPSSLTRYSNVSFQQPIGSDTHPPGGTVQWSLSAGGTALSIGTFTGILSGSFSNSTTIDVTANVISSGATTTVPIQLIALADSVSFPNVSSNPQTLSLQVEQQQNSESNLLATAASGQPLTQTVDDPIALNSFQLQLTDGVIEGYPLSAGSLPLVLTATTPQFVSNTLTLSYTIFPNTITFDPSQNFSVVPPQFIQGRDITGDYSALDRTYRATTAQNTVVDAQSTGDLNGTGLQIIGSNLVGTPLTSFSSNVTITARRGDVSNTLTSLQTVVPDQWVLIQPTQTDFVLSTGDSVSQALQTLTQSQIGISGQSLSGTVAGVSVTSGGILTLNGTSAGGPTEFTLLVETQAGVTLSKNFTLTVNSGTFTSPTSTSALLPVGSSVVAATDPVTTLTLSSALTGFAFDGSNFSNTSGTVYPPELVVFQSSSSLNQPLRVATSTLSLSVASGNTNWIQQVNVDTITVSGSSPSGDPVYFLCPNPPPGMIWDPISNTLTGAPTELTLYNTFTVWGTDGYTSGAVTVPQRTRVPQYLRAFTAPSGFTQQVRQRAIVNGAAHAYGRNAVLPDPLIATQGGQYPPDVSLPDQACIEGTVYQF